MLAMDVVDTLRHSRRLVEKELNSEESDAQLLRRLRDIYASQGIEVPDEILRQGVAALKEQRFVYKPPPSGLSTLLARIYVRRKRWITPLLTNVAVLVVIWYGDYFDIQRKVRSLVERPATESTDVVEAEPLVETKEVVKTKKVAGAKQAVLDDLAALLRAIEALAPKEAILARARGIFEQGTGAIGAGDLVKAHEAADDLTKLHELLALTFEMRIVSRPNQPSGVWRVPDANPEARNYYLIVEAVDGSGNRLQVELTSEEDGQTREVIMWGVRVPVHPGMDRPADLHRADAAAADHYRKLRKQIRKVPRPAGGRELRGRHESRARAERAVRRSSHAGRTALQGSNDSSDPRRAEGALHSHRLVRGQTL